jgi:hypothetical protein
MRDKKYKVLKLAEMANVTSVLLTAKGEPMLNFSSVKEIAQWFASYPLEIQTNGLWLNSVRDDRVIMDQLGMSNIDVIAFSIDHVSMFDMFKELFTTLRSHYGFILRATVNVSDLLNGANFRDILSQCKDHGIHQLMIRKLSVPDNVPETDPTAKWIYDHAPANLFNDMMRDMEAAVKTRGFPVRDLPFREDGHIITIYDLDGISVAASRYCIQESSVSTDIRSLIWLPDGHIYTSWGSRASILF